MKEIKMKLAGNNTNIPGSKCTCKNVLFVNIFYNVFLNWEVGTDTNSSNKRPRLPADKYHKCT